MPTPEQSQETQNPSPETRVDTPPAVPPTPEQLEQKKQQREELRLAEENDQTGRVKAAIEALDKEIAELEKNAGQKKGPEKKDPASKQFSFSDFFKHPAENFHKLLSHIAQYLRSWATMLRANEHPLLASFLDMVAGMDISILSEKLNGAGRELAEAAKGTMDTSIKTLKQCYNQAHVYASGLTKEQYYEQVVAMLPEGTTVTIENVVEAAKKLVGIKKQEADAKKAEGNDGKPKDTAAGDGAKTGNGTSTGAAPAATETPAVTPPTASAGTGAPSETPAASADSAAPQGGGTPSPTI